MIRQYKRIQNRTKAECQNCTPRREQSIPPPRVPFAVSERRGRYADAPAAALLTGLGAGEWARHSASGARPYAHLPGSGPGLRCFANYTRFKA
jgi:hypothetical protein